jgi:hypothetical protein
MREKMRRRGIRGNEGTDEEEGYQREQKRRRGIRGMRETMRRMGVRWNEGTYDEKSIRARKRELGGLCQGEEGIVGEGGRLSHLNLAECSAQRSIQLVINMCKK